MNHINCKSKKHSTHEYTFNARIDIQCNTFKNLHNRAHGKDLKILRTIMVTIRLKGMVNAPLVGNLMLGIKLYGYSANCVAWTPGLADPSRESVTCLTFQEAPLQLARPGNSSKRGWKQICIF
jgi:hypothetical protein